jgi:hypothetical protein
MHFLLLGVDSLIACIAIGAIVDSRWRLPLVALFGVADAVGLLIGAGLGWQLSESLSAVLVTGTLVTLGLYLVVVAAAMPRVAASWPVWVVPWALTLDNLAYGAAGQGSGSLLQQGTEQGLSSALMALIGLYVAVALPRVFPGMERRAAATRVAGGALVLAAGGLILLG